MNQKRFIALHKVEDQFKSKLFRRLFFTYTVMILLFLVGYNLIVIRDYNRHTYEQKKQEYRLNAQELANKIDAKIMEAEYAVNSINGSATIKALYGTTVTAGSIPDSYLLTQVMDEMKAIINHSDSLFIYNILLFMNGSNRAYTASSVLSLPWEYDMSGGNNPEYIQYGTITELFGYQSRNILFNKEYILYCSDYNFANSIQSKGTIVILINPEIMKRLIGKVIDEDCGFAITMNDQVVLEEGSKEEISFLQTSSVSNGLCYQLYVPKSKFHTSLDAITLSTIGISILFSIVFIIISWFVSKRHYSPYANIVSILQSKNDKLLGMNPEEHLMEEIGSLITETNASKDRIVQISPYVKQGILSEILSGNTQEEQFKLLYGEDYIGTEMVFFAIGIINLTVDAPKERHQEITEHVIKQIDELTQKMSTKRCNVNYYVKDASMIYCILNLDDAQDWEDIFYRLKKELDDNMSSDSVSMTIGVGQLKDDLTLLKAACQEAQEALSNMLTGGRNAIYFYEDKQEKSDDYYFPKDAAKLLQKAFKDKNMQLLKDFLQELYEKNIIHNDLSIKAVELMIDELHLTTVNVLKSFNAFCTISIQINRIAMPATIDEVFAYYELLYETILCKMPKLIDTKENLEKAEEDILSYIEDHFTDPELSLSYLMEKFHVTNKFISVLCNNHYGLNYLQYVQKKRIMYAVERIREGKYSIEEIAEMSGYTNVLTFRRNFKSIVGMNPSEYQMNE